MAPSVTPDTEKTLLGATTRGQGPAQPSAAVLRSRAAFFPKDLMLSQPKVQAEPAGRGCNGGTDAAGRLLWRDPCLHRVQDPRQKDAFTSWWDSHQGLAMPWGRGTAPAQPKKRGPGPNNPRAWHADPSAQHSWVRGGVEEPGRAGASSPEPLPCQELQAGSRSQEPRGKGSVSTGRVAPSQAIWQAKVGKELFLRNRTKRIIHSG